MTDDPPITSLEGDGDRRERRARKARRRRAFGVGILATFAIVLSVITVAVFFVTGASVHFTAHSALEEELARRLETTAKLAVHELGGDTPDWTRELVRSLGDENPATRRYVQGILRRIRETSGARDVVVVAANGGKILASGQPGTSETPSSASQILAHSETIARVVHEGAAACTALYFLPEAGDEGRYFKTGYAPLAVDGTVALVVGVDLPADFTASVERVDRRFTLLGAGACLAVLGSAVFLVRQRVYVPIYRLVRAMEGGDANDEAEPGRPVRARVRWRDEIGALTEHYNAMVDRLQSQENELRKLYAEAQKRAEFVGGYAKYLVDELPSAVVAVDPEGKVIVWNEPAQRILRKGGPAVVGKPLAEALGPDHPVARALERGLRGEVSDEALVALGPAGDAEAGEADHEDAGARLVELAAGPFKNPESGAVLGAAALVHDRTELERLRRAATRNERLAAIGRLAAGLAHEIRNPLGAISGFAELIERKRGVDDSARLATRLRGEVNELNRFLTEFLVFARDQKIKRGAEDLNDLFRRAAETAIQATGVSVDDTRKVLESGAVARPDGGRLELVFEGDPTLGEAEVDGAALKAALVNLIKNAIEAMKGTGTVFLRARRANDRAVLRVRDTGPGIPTDLREKIFDPFFTTRDHGVGLGLAIAHKIVAAHGGKIAVRSPDEGGCEFVVRIPLTTEAATRGGPQSGEDDITPRQGATTATRTASAARTTSAAPASTASTTGSGSDLSPVPDGPG